MPIYEFYCPDCHVLLNFLSRKVDTRTAPACPRCGGKRLTREVSLFAALRGGREEDGGAGADDLPLDDARMERAMESLAAEAESLDENDPRAAAQLMRKFSDATGMEYGGAMQEALQRLESGEDPEAVEAELGDVMEQEDPFLPGATAASRTASRRHPPRRDKTLYEM